MSNVVTLHTDKRWKAVIEYEHQNGPIKIEHYFEEIADLHLIIEHGPDWKPLPAALSPLTGMTVEPSRTAKRSR